MANEIDLVIAFKGDRFINQDGDVVTFIGINNNNGEYKYIMQAENGTTYLVRADGAYNYWGEQVYECRLNIKDRYYGV